MQKKIRHWALFNRLSQNQSTGHHKYPSEQGNVTRRQVMSSQVTTDFSFPSDWLLGYWRGKGVLSNNTLCINKWFTIPLFNHIGAKKLLNPVNIKFLFCFQTGRQEESKSYLVITCTFFFIHIHTFIYGKKYIYFDGGHWRLPGRFNYSNNCFTKNDLKTSLNIANFISYDNHWWCTIRIYGITHFPRKKSQQL